MTRSAPHRTGLSLASRRPFSTSQCVPRFEIAQEPLFQRVIQSFRADSWPGVVMRSR